MRRAVPIITLVFLSIALGWAVFCKGGVWPDQWCVSLAFIGLASCFFWLLSKPAPSLLHSWLLIALPVYIALTLIPLPVRLLDILCPARAALLHQLQPIIPSTGSAPLTVNPPATVLALFTTLGYIAVFLAIRGIALSLRRRLWVLIVPVLLIAGFEALLGLLQSFAANVSTAAAGTYANRDHFAGLLEMTLPFALLSGCAAFAEKNHGARQTKSIAVASACWLLAALLFVAILYSLSRMGFMVALFVLFLTAVLSLRGRLARFRSKWLIAAGAGAAIVMASVLITPDQLAGRFAAFSGANDSSTEIRAAIWQQTLPLISEFKFFGCGMGGFASVFLTHQNIANAYAVEFAHNDYLQYLAELGLIGFSLLLAAIAVLARGPLRALLAGRESNQLLLIACAASLAGMALHSFVDFNTYIPANAMVLAWIGGLASATSQE